VEHVDLGPCGGQLFDGDSERVAILLPGAAYVPAAPLLWYAREVLQAEAWTVLQVWDTWDRSDDAHQWVAERFEAALEYVGQAPSRLIVAKSLTSLAIPAAAERDLPGVWLTPLLNRPDVRAGLEASNAPTLAVGGTADETWDSRFVANLTNLEVLEIDGADHTLQHPGDPAASIGALLLVVERIRRFVKLVA